MKAAQSFVGQTLPSYFASAECSASCFDPDLQIHPRDVHDAHTSRPASSSSSSAERTRNSFTRLILDYEHQRIVGLISFAAGAAEPGVVQIGLAIDPARRRQGYGKAALRIVLDTARSDPNVHTLHIVLPADHTIAAHLANLVGFTPFSPHSDDGAQRWSLNLA